jgi:hypothetical protein
LGRQAEGKGFKGIKREEGIKEMKDIFMFLLVNLKNFGELKTANMYDSTFANIKFESKRSEYEISIHRKDKIQEEEKNA